MGLFTKKKKKQEVPEDDRKWSDLSEDRKFVIHGGKIKCSCCSVPIADIIVTSNTISLQSKYYATTADNNGKINFDFQGICTAFPSITKPPCKAVIQLGQWKNYSDTMINDDNAILVRSTIPCIISGCDLEIVHSGQIEVLTDIEPRVIKNPRITRIYWTYENDLNRLGNQSRFYVDMNLHIETKDYEQGETLSIELKSKNGIPLTDKQSNIIITGTVDESGSVILKNALKDYTLNLTTDESRNIII